MRLVVNETLKILGEEITRQRESKGLTINQVAQSSKISERFIEKMEQGAFDFLPEANMKAFLRLVSSEIGLDPDVMVRRLMAELHPSAPLSVPDEAVAEESQSPEIAPLFQPKEVESSIERNDSKSRTPEDVTQWIKNPLILGAVLVAVLAAFWFLFYRTPAQPPSAMDSGISVPSTTLESSTDTTVTLVPITEENKPDSVRAELLTLNLKASETAWVRIVYQDTLAEEGVFTAGIDRSWTSREKFYLKIGNAGGVRLFLNSRDLGTPGDVGQVVNILVDQSGITPISLSELPAAMGSSTP